MSKRSLSSWLVMPLLVAVGCGGGGHSGAAADMTEGGDLAVVSNTHDMSVSVEADMSTPPDLSAPNQGPAPFIVDSTYAASGYYSDNGASLSDTPSCPTRGGAGRGTCHHIAYVPASSAGGYAGILWQYPANNWPGPSEMPGYALPAGYTQVQFYAWGAAGGEKLSFFAGDGVDSKVTGTPATSELDVTLTTTPTLYTLGVSNIYGATTISAFRWETQAGAAPAATFNIDDIVWAAPSTGVSPKAFAIDTNFVAAGYMGDGANPGELVDEPTCTPTVMGASGCHHFVWNPTIDGGAPTNGWAGVYWQSPSGNWGGATDPVGAAIPAGYTEVSFYAWTAAGGEIVSFFAGLGKDNFATKINAVMTTTPTLYTLGVGGAYGAHVVGGFGWSVGGAGTSLDIIGVQWR